MFALREDCVLVAGRNGRLHIKPAATQGTAHCAAGFGLAAQTRH
jgi:hypothetical protein